MSRTAVAEAAQNLNQRFDLPEQYDPAVSIELLVESGHNARRKFDQTSLNELADSIRQHGVVQPLVVRPFRLNGATSYEIVAGSRRYRASKIAGRTHVPLVIREYSDFDVLELHIVENIQRKDLDPIDEAASYKALIESDPKYTAGYIAQRIGRKEAYVWETIRLLNLVPLAQSLLEAGRITRSHGELISRLKHDQQERLIAWAEDGSRPGALWTADTASLRLDDDAPVDNYDGLKPISVRELESHIVNHVRLDVKHAAEIAPLEYGEAASRIEAAMALPGRAKKVISITHLSHVPSDAKDENERTFTEQAWKRADGTEDSKRCDYRVLGTVAVGPGQGETFDVCIAKDKCDVHWKSERTAKAKVEKLKGSGQSEKAKEIERQRRDAEEVELRKRDESRALWNVSKPAIIDAVAAQLKRMKPVRMAQLVLDSIDGSYNGQYGKTARARIPAKNKADDIVRHAALIVMVREIDKHYAPENFPRLAKKFGVDVKAILKNVQKQKTAKGAK